jgi:ATP-dependent DNA helicase RecG
MDREEFDIVLQKGEGTRVEFKEAFLKVPSTFYESVCSFLNKEGGIILLGVTDDKIIKGVNVDIAEQLIKNIITSCNDKDLLNPPTTLSPTKLMVDNALIIAVKVSVSSQVHLCKHIIYDRENDIDLRITDDNRINEIYFRKRQIFTENQIFTKLSINDLDSALFMKAKAIIKSANPSHPWLLLNDMELLRSASLYRKDFQTGEEGLTLSAALIFGKVETIRSILPAYKVEALVRIQNIDRWDDRIIPPLATNLIDTYLLLMEFTRKHLNESFYLNEKGQRVDLRELIFREVVANCIVHREYTNNLATEFLIEKDTVTVTNPNKTFYRGYIDKNAFSPYAKNPNIRKFFTAFGWTDEIGSGIRNINKYLPFYTYNAEALFLEDDTFKTLIPLKTYSLALVENDLLAFLQMRNMKAFVGEGIKDISLSSNIAHFLAEDILKQLVPRWRQDGTKLNLFNKLIYNELIFNEIKTVSGWEELGAKLIERKGLYFLQIMVLCLQPKSMNELLDLLNYSNRASFREKYLNILDGEGYIEKTNKEKPSSKNQKYYATQKAKLFLGGFDL